ncbi:MAG TPA: hypothetical protein VGP16_02680 [Asanoa sp.]|nr:hypothetical protein [Asanoa sp.]
MAYRLAALIGAPAVLRAAVQSQPAAVVVPLPQALALVPMTGDLFLALGGVATLGFDELPEGLDRVLASCSSGGPISYVEAEYFGGEGTQRAALWVDGSLAAGPLSADADGSPISQILRLMGVRRSGQHDEFDALGLGRHRETEKWPKG